MKKQLSAAYRYSYSRLALNFYMFYETMCEANHLPEAVQTYREEFYQLVACFLEGRDESVRLETLRNSIIKEMETMTAYTDCFQIYEYVLNRMERRYFDGAPIQESVKDLAGRLVESVVRSRDPGILNSRIQDIIGQLPVRYTRQKFYSCLMDGLSVYIGSDKSSLENLLYVLRTESMVQLPEGMEDGYGQLYEVLDQLKKTDYHHMEQNGYQICRERIDDACEILQEYADTYMLMQDMINDLYVLFLTDRDAMVNLAETQMMKKIVTGVLEKSQAGNTSKIEDEVTELLYELEGIQEHAMERYLSCASPAEDSEDALDEKFLNVEILLSSSPFAKLHEEPAAQETADRLWVEQQITDFCRELDCVFAQSAKPVTRAIMAKLLSSLPVAFQSSDEFERYIIESLESCSDIAERETCMELLIQLMVVEDELV